MIKILDEANGEYKVYAHINKINGKIYIGQTKQTLEQRFNHGNGYKHCRHFNSSIQKYGWDNFEHIILVDNLSIDMANIIEEELIKKYNTTNHNNGYNMKSGGLNHIPSEETRKLLSETHRGERHWNYGKHWGDDFKKKLSEIHTGREITPEWRKNMSIAMKNRGSFSEEHKKKISLSKMGERNPMYGKDISPKLRKIFSEKAKKVLQYDLDGNFIKKWNTASDILKEYDVDLSNIFRCCIGERSSCGGYIWEYMVNDIIPEKTIPYKDRIKENTMVSKYKKVYQYDIDGNYLREFSSANEVKESLGAYTNHIRDCCLGNLKSYLGYRWSYEKVDKLPSIKYKTNAIPVIQFDKDWKFIKEWKSALEINETLNIDQSSIGRCCKGKQETAGGYRWKYKTDCE